MAKDCLGGPFRLDVNKICGDQDLNFCILAHVKEARDFSDCRQVQPSGGEGEEGAQGALIFSPPSSKGMTLFLPYFLL